MTPKKYFIVTLSLFLLVFSIPAIITVIYDPYFIIHKNNYEKIKFDAWDRYQNAGLINSFLADPKMNFDTIIIGTSMSQNLPVSTFKNATNTNILKLTVAGGRPRELAAVASKAIATGRVKRVIWEIHASYDYDDPNILHHKSPLPLYLYNQSRFDDWRYIFNHDTYKKSFKLLKGKTKGRQELKSLYSWENKEEFKDFLKTKNLVKLKKDIDNVEEPIRFTPKIETNHEFPNLKQNLLPILKNNPTITFDLYFAPLSYIAYARKENTDFWKQMQMRKTLLQEVSNLKNVTVHNFDIMNNGPEVLSNYKDITHFSPELSARISQRIERKNNTLGINQWDGYTLRFIDKINRFKRNFKPE